MNTRLLYTIFAIIALQFAANSQSCSKKRFCDKNTLGEYFDYRGQSTFGRLSPGDTSRIKVVLYSKNTVRILTCADEELGNVKFRIIKTVREYNRVIDHIEKTTIEEPIYKMVNGKKVPVYDDWGDIALDEIGDTLYEVASTKDVVFSDTIWKTQRNIREEILFDSEKNPQGLSYFEEEIKKTKSVIIEVIVPETEDSGKNYYEGCVAVMVGRMYHYGDYKKFSSQ